MDPDKLRAAIARLRTLGMTDVRIAAHIPGASATTVRRWVSRGEIDERHKLALLVLLGDAEKAKGKPPLSKFVVTSKAAPERLLPPLDEVAEVVEFEGPITTQELADRLRIRVRDARDLLEELKAGGQVKVKTERMWSLAAPREARKPVLSKDEKLERRQRAHAVAARLAGQAASGD